MLRGVGRINCPASGRTASKPHPSVLNSTLDSGGGESPTFPQVRLGCPSLWSAISSISALAGRVSGAGLCWRFSNFRFGGAETGSIADRESGLQGALQNQAYAGVGASPRRASSLIFTTFVLIYLSTCRERSAC